MKWRKSNSSTQKSSQYPTWRTSIVQTRPPTRCKAPARGTMQALLTDACLVKQALPTITTWARHLLQRDSRLRCEAPLMLRSSQGQLWLPTLDYPRCKSSAWVQTLLKDLLKSSASTHTRCQRIQRCQRRSNKTASKVCDKRLLHIP